jgi:hypothetical protein
MGGRSAASLDVPRSLDINPDTDYRPKHPK